MKPIEAPLFIKQTLTILRRFHLTIFITFIVVCLGLAVALFTMILNQPATTDSTSTPTATTNIDQTTLERLKSLHSSDDTSSPYTAPAGRDNPFSE